MQHWLCFLYLISRVYVPIWLEIKLQPYDKSLHHCTYLWGLHTNDNNNNNKYFVVSINSSEAIATNYVRTYVIVIVGILCIAYWQCQYYWTVEIIMERTKVIYSLPYMSSHMVTLFRNEH